MIGFASPWILAALVTLPALWLLLRLLPPAPTQIRFPALRLLQGLTPRRDSAARMPWWLLALRLTLLALLILGAAGPSVHPNPPAHGATALLLVIDDSWAAAHDWNQRRQALADQVAQAARLQRPLLLLQTARPQDGAAIAVQGPLSASAAQSLISAMVPKPWPSDAEAASQAVRAMNHDRVTEVVWVSDGLDNAGHDGAKLARALQSLGGGVSVVQGESGHILSLSDGGGGDQAALLVRSLPMVLPHRLAVRGLDDKGQVLAREETLLATGQGQARVVLRLPVELRNRLARLDIEDEQSAAATLLLDEGWKRRIVGLADQDDSNTPLLAPYYYVDRALAPYAEITRGDIASLLDRRPDALILADQVLRGEDSDALLAWVRSGGALIRFAGPRIAAAIPTGGELDPLMPVRLRPGGRSLGGAMSWTTAQGLSALPADTPLSDLTAPADVKILSQVLAEPDPSLNDKVWAQLTDGTPLITAERRGHGWVVLVHVTANASWSNLPLSGLFPDLLRRLIGLGTGGQPANGTLAAGEILDGFGQIHPAGGIVQSLPSDASRRRPSPETPPGLYGPEGGRVAFNLGPWLDKPMALDLPAGVERRSLAASDSPRDLSGLAFAAALVLVLADLLLAARLRSTALAALVLLVLAPQPSRAGDDFALKAALSTRLAFVHTGDGFVDGKARSGLTALSRVVGERSTARLDTPMAVDLERDPILFFPIVYWPLSPEQKPLSAAA
ncbi:MAG: BatA domain-containing protein, partial [Magnetospirillum sp.]